MNLNEYSGKKVLITGGLGFIGSNLAERLVELGAKVTILDANLPRYGANIFNIAHFKDKIVLEYGDIRDPIVVKRNVADKEIIFNLAGQVDHNYSMEDPHLDIDINCKGHINVLEECKKNNPSCRILFPGSRFQYGKISDSDLPVNENQKLRPLSIYAVNKTAGEMYYKAYHDHHGLNTVMFRIGNPYGPRAQIKHAGYCIVNWFIRKAIQGEDITVFGEGTQLRDYIYISDLVEAFIIAGIHPKAKGQVYNVCSGVGTQFMEMAQKAKEFVGKGNVVQVPWPKNYQNVETGNYWGDISKIHHELGWTPKFSFDEGLKKTIDFYKVHLDKYI